MTAAANNTPISVDYTGRDYFAIREQLIKRVQDRVPDWQGSDPNDFGLALVEAFSYMGDLVNFYIDRIANETHILTATQRETLLNLAASYGYKPANYVSASTTLTITNSQLGYKGEIGGAIIEDGDDVFTQGNYAKIIVPNDHPFEIGDIIKVNSMPNETSPSTIGDKTFIFNTSVFNGVFPVINTGYDSFGKNVVWYRPAATIAGIEETDPGTFSITMNEVGRTMSPLSGQKILISDVSVVSGPNYNGKWVIDNTIQVSEDVAATISVKVADSVADVTAARVDGGSIRYAAWNDFVIGQTISITGAATAAFNLADVQVTAVKSVEAAVSQVVTTGTDVTYYVSEEFEVGDYVTIRRIASVGNELAQANLRYNLTNKVISTVGVDEATINSVVCNAPAADLITYQTSSAHGFSVGDYVTISGVVNVPSGDIIGDNILNLRSAKIVASTETSFVLEGYWNVEYDGAASTAAKASRYFFVLDEEVEGNVTSSGTVVSEYFSVEKPVGFTETVTTFTDGKATPQIGGTWLSGGTIVYDYLPTIVVNGPFVTEIGSTTVPKGTQVATQVTVDGATKKVVFSTQADAVVPYRESSEVLALHGEDISLREENKATPETKPYDINGELLGYSNGEADQSFALQEVQVDTNTIRVFIDTGTSWEEWTKVQNIQDYTPSSRIFEIQVLASEEVRVVFGDGISGAIPNKEAGIKATYIAGGGSIGNVAANSLTTWDIVLGVDADDIRTMTVTNHAAAVGGANPESNDSIRYNAPRALRALNRAVTLEDFAALALSIDGVVKSNAVASSRSSVTVYIAPNSTGEAEETPGTDFNGTPNTQLAGYIQLVDQYLEDKKQIGTSVTVLGPIYEPVNVGVQYSVLPQYNAATIATQLKKTILSEFSYENLEFADVITPEEIEFKLRQVEGVANVRVTDLFRNDGSGRNSLIGEPYEIFSFTEDKITVAEADTEGRVNTITFTALDDDGVELSAPEQLEVLVSPTVNGEVFTYTLSLPAGTGFARVAVTPLSATATVSVNDKAQTGTYVDIEMGIHGPNIILVTVTAEDGVTVNSYRFKVTVAL